VFVRMASIMRPPLSTSVQRDTTSLTTPSSYSKGSLWFSAMRRVTPDLDARISRGDFAPVFDWLRAHIWEPASRWTTDELVTRASGEPLNPVHFKAHLQARYL